MLRLLAAVCIGTVLTSSGAAAQQDCSKALINSTVTSSSKEITQLSLAWTLSESSYDEAKKEAGASGVIYGVPVSANYSQFRQAVKNRAESLGIERFEFRAYAYATSGLDKTSLEAYKACLLSNGGLQVLSGASALEHHVLWIIYNPPIDVSRNLSGRVVSADNVTQASRQTLSKEVESTKFDGRIDIQINLTPADLVKETAIVIRVGNQSSSLVLPPLKWTRPIAPCANVDAAGSCTRCEWALADKRRTFNDTCPRMPKNATISVLVDGELNVSYGTPDDLKKACSAWATIDVAMGSNKTTNPITINGDSQFHPPCNTPIVGRSAPLLPSSAGGDVSITLTTKCTYDSREWDCKFNSGRIVVEGR